MTIFDYDNYKTYVNDWISLQPSGGHGQLRQLALHLGINSVVMSQVFRGDRDLTLEQAVGVSKFLGLPEIERDHFLQLVQIARAGSLELKKVLESRLTVMKSESKALKNRIKHAKFTNEDRATFYSQWYYSAIRLGVSIPDLKSVTAIADYLHLDRGLVSKVVEFLAKNKLIVEERSGFDIGPQVTHVGHDSPFVNRHHSNWRLKALQSMDKLSDDNLFYTGPMALSREAADLIRRNLVEVIEKSTEAASSSDSDNLRCLNIDWFKV